jgi:hypothetical protein
MQQTLDHDDQRDGGRNQLVNGPEVDLELD